MARVAAVLPGYASVARASEVLHLAPRSVRDLIYSGRLPSLRVGRLHYVRAADLELERRRRLGLPLLKRRAAAAARHRRARSDHEATPPRPLRPPVDAAARRQRAAERAALVTDWARRHHAEAASPRVPFTQLVLQAPAACEACGRHLDAGARGLSVEAGTPTVLCLTCGRRALLQWADQRRLEAAAARAMAHDLGVRPDQAA